jgi:hypothetical protein
MTTNPMQTAARRARRDRRFDHDAACVRCGITAPETLVPVKRRFLDDHHVCVQANDDALTVPVCRNCHAILTEAQHAAGVVFQTPPTILHQVASALASFFAMLHALCERGMAWAHALSELASDLDTAYPAWRTLPSAKALGVGS